MINLLLVLAGAVLCNAVPHLVRGLMGKKFPTPFANPPGKGLSSALVNVCWGAVNLAVGLFLASRDPFAPGLNGPTLSVAIGAAVMGVFMFIHFSRVMREHQR